MGDYKHHASITTCVTPFISDEIFIGHSKCMVRSGLPSVWPGSFGPVQKYRQPIFAPKYQ